jgi:uncharacterized tellurite resistance protein B-like protein
MPVRAARARGTLPIVVAKGVELFFNPVTKQSSYDLCLSKFSVMEIPVQRLDHLKNLVIMAAADGALTEQEIALLVDRCADLGLAEEDLEKAIDFALGGGAKLQFPIDRFEQDQMLRDLIRMMAADGKLSEVEKRLFALAAAKMGIEKEELDGLIDQLVGKQS